MKIIRNFYQGLDVFMKAMIVTISLVMITAAFMQVFSRDILRDTWAWTDELSRLCMVWITFIGVALCVRYDRNIKIDTLYALFPKKVVVAVDFLIYICTIGVGFTLVMYGLVLVAATNGQFSPALHWRMDMMYSVIPFSGLTMILFTLELLLNRFGKDKIVPKLNGGVE